MQTRRYGHMVHEYYLARLREIYRRRRQRLDSLRTRRDAEAYVRDVRRAARRSLGPLPKRTPLNPRITGRREYGGYILEKVIFESRPGLLVTGNILLPRSAGSAKRPCVLGLCGHSANGKAYENYQLFAQGLAAKGFVVLVIDPIAQGERQQFYPEDGGPVLDSVLAHNMMGNQMTLVGDFFGAWRVWDATRAMDYLLGRPEADPAHIGVTGCSGGGTLTTLLTAIDPRPTMVAPVCYITSWAANMANEIPADAEQNPPDAMAMGLDEADLLLAYAPRPTLIVASEDDFFDERSARQAHQDVRQVHRLLGSPNSAAYRAVAGSHGFSQEAREAMYAFFMHHAGIAGSAGESGVAVVADEEIYAMPGGKTLPRDSRRVFEYTAETARSLAQLRGRPPAAEVASAAQRLLGVRLDRRPPHYRALWGYWGWAKELRMHRQFAVETEAGIVAIATTYGPGHGMMHPPKGPVTLYVGHTDGHADVQDVPQVRALTQGPGHLVAVDPRGIGQTMAQTCGSEDFFDAYGSDYLYASTGEMLGEPLLGRRVHDVLRTIDWLTAKSAEVSIMGRGVGSITAAFAALLHPAKPKVRLLHYLPSYHLLTQHAHNAWPLSCLLRGVLRHFDLTDVYRALGGRLELAGPWDHLMQPLT